MDDMNDPTAWIERLNAPRSVAVVGASEDIRLPGGRLLQYLLSYGFSGSIYPVNPNRESVQGRKAYASLLELPEAVDIAVVLVAAAATEEVLTQCATVGIPIVMIGSSGFSETGPEGEALQQRVAALARAAGIRIIGPNTNGIIITGNGFTATFSPVLDQQGLGLRDGPIAIVSQSGAIGAGLYYDGQRNGLKIGRLYNLGNEIDLTLELMIDSLLAAVDVQVILAYVEGLRRPARFIEAARKAQALGKRLVLLKSGVTPAGARAAAAHTASLAGEDRVYDGVLHQLGVVRAHGMTHLLDVGRVLAAYPGGIGRRVSILSMSGGIGIMLTDELEKAGMSLASFGEEVLAQIDPLLPGFLGRQNPLDVSGGPFHYLDRLRSLLQIFDRNPESDLTIIAVGAFERRQLEIAQAIADEVPRLSKPVFVLWFAGGDAASLLLNSAGIACFPDTQRLVKAVAPALRSPRRTLQIRPSERAPAAIEARAFVEAARHAGRTLIDEVEGKKILAAYGLDIARECVVRSVSEVAEAIAGLQMPVVAKLRSQALVHKARVGGVRLGLTASEAVEVAVADLLALAERLELPQADVVLQEQVPAGVELLLGAKRDETFGMVITLGIGGVQAEAWDDVQVRLADFDLEADDLLYRLRHQSLIDGSSGRPPVNPAALSSTLRGFVHLVRDLGDTIDAIDVNPIIVHDPTRPPVAVDTVIFLANQT